MWFTVKKNHKCYKIMFKIYLKILILKTDFNWIFMNNLLVVLLF